MKSKSKVSKVKRPKLVKDEKRPDVIFARVAPANHKFAHAEAAKKEISVSAYIDGILERRRTERQ